MRAFFFGTDRLPGDGSSPRCDSYEARLMELLDPYAKGIHRV
jgi:hypothetical protein